MTPWLYDLQSNISDENHPISLRSISPDSSTIILARTIKPIINIRLSIDQPTILEPFPCCRCLIEVVGRPVLRCPVCQMRRDIDVQLVRNSIDVSVHFVPPQTATRRRAVGFVHVVEDRLCGLEVLAVAGYVVDRDPVVCQLV